jgi:hypothetical protein
MKPISFIDRKYQEVVIRQQAGAFSALNQAQQDALTNTLTVMRFFSSIPFAVLYFFEYFLVLAHMRRKPEPRLEHLREMVEKEKAADHLRKTGGKTLGFVKGSKK